MTNWLIWLMKTCDCLKWEQFSQKHKERLSMMWLKCWWNRRKMVKLTLRVYKNIPQILLSSGRRLAMKILIESLMNKYDKFHKRSRNIQKKFTPWNTTWKWKAINWLEKITMHKKLFSLNQSYWSWRDKNKNMHKSSKNAIKMHNNFHPKTQKSIFNYKNYFNKQKNNISC